MTGARSASSGVTSGDGGGGTDGRLSLAEVGELATAILDEVERAIVGKRQEVGLVLLGILAGGHILLEDVPGVAKTLAARCLCQASGLSYSRIQFTPDLMPADVTGSSFYDARRAELEFRPGPLFANLVLGDEINRAPPKTQAALLEAMQEHQVTADGTTHLLPAPFAVIATQNPIEYEGTYPLPEAQLDRFLLRVSIGYPERSDEQELVQRRALRGGEDAGLRPVTNAAGILAMQAAVERVEIAEPVTSYLVDVVRATRQMAGVQVGASPRASVALMQASRARAALSGRDVRPSRRHQSRRRSVPGSPPVAPARDVAARRAVDRADPAVPRQRARARRLRT